MNEKSTRLFIDSGVHLREDPFSSDMLYFPLSPGALIADEKTLLSPAAKQRANRLTIDDKLKLALKPIIQDRNVLKPEIFYALVAETHDALINQHHNEKDAEAKESLNDLILLLENNADLTSLVGQSINHIQKA